MIGKLFVSVFYCCLNCTPQELVEQANVNDNLFDEKFHRSEILILYINMLHFPIEGKY